MAATGLARVALAASMLLTWASAQTWTADNGNGTFTNPLFFDEFSDPDMIRVGPDYYLTGTTMHSMPGLPILHSRDLVNWTFLGYALDRLDLGPSFRLEEGKSEYGRGIWAPCFRYHNGTFYIFSNVNGQKTQLFRASDPKGPWTRTPMKVSLHDLSVLFDDDGKVYVAWGYRGIRLAELTPDLSDIVPGSERETIGQDAGMGEGVHFYKLRGRYFLTSAWYLDEMRMPVARADRVDGPWEVNQEISRGEDFGLGVGYRLSSRRPPLRISDPDTSQLGRCAIHQGGIVDTPTGEWWGFSMMDANSVGRLTALSPVTWKDDWPYFGLPGNLGRTPRTWVKPDTGSTSPPRAPYERSDSFSSVQLGNVWQWNHVPVDGKWSLTERRGFLRLHALPATDVWSARNTLTQRAIGPRSTVTVAMDAARLEAGDVAGLALFNRPYAWLGVERDTEGLALVQFDEVTGNTVRAPLRRNRVWLRAECDFVRNEAVFRYSTDGKRYTPIGGRHKMAYGLITFQGVRYSLFAYNRAATGEGGAADFDSIEVVEEPKHPIPYGKRGSFLAEHNNSAVLVGGESVYTLIDQRLGRVALKSGTRFVSVDEQGATSLREGKPGEAETFQWMEAFDGGLLLMSLRTNRFLRIDPASGKVIADSTGPLPNRLDGVRFQWRRR
ncbi:MAG: family 43 glycosylhydrolase [Bryobacterales bacterium]|nr:family 43 glycosylhydrolase [Bryobacterales bacterium]